MREEEVPSTERSVGNLNDSNYRSMIAVVEDT